MIYGNAVGGTGIERTYILVDENGNEYPATFVDKETKFDATPNDIRLGKVAATEIGVVTGEKDIPAYHTTEGFKTITVGSSMKIKLPGNKCDYTKFQALVCSFNTSLADSVATYIVSIGDKVYEVNSTVELSSITVDTNSSSIDLGLFNTSDKICIIRYMTYKEEE